MSEKGSLTWAVTPDILGILDKSGVFTDTNPAWRKTLGLLPESIESRPFFDFVHPADIARTREAFVDIQTGRPVLGFENRYRHADGSYRWLSWNAIPVDDRFFCSARDVTAQKMSEAALRTSEQEAALREQFVAVLGHDLRNPLAALRSGMNILKRKYDSEDDRDLMKAMDGSITRMAVLIDDVMDFARARLGDGIASQPKQPVRLTATFRETVQELRSANPDATILERYEYDEPVLCEARRMSQLLSNLLSNAITHGDPHAPIEVRAYARDGDFRISVTNSGDRIPDAARPLLFEPFSRADLRGAQTGLGLGLFIASEIAKGHEGRLTFTSDAGTTVFTASIPKGEAPAG